MVLFFFTSNYIVIKVKVHSFTLGKGFVTETKNPERSLLLEATIYACHVMVVKMQLLNSFLELRMINEHTHTHTHSLARGMSKSTSLITKRSKSDPSGAA